VNTIGAGMTTPASSGAGVLGGSLRSAVRADSPDEARLREACAQLEGVFMTQLMKLMRETVPEGGALDGGAGEEVFSSMLDERMSELAASRQEHGLGAALFRQLRAALAAQAMTTGTPVNGATPASEAG
jgi:flagellar protein FlgJ